MMKSITILLVAIDRTLCKEITKIVKANGYSKIFIANNGNDGIKLYHEHHPHILISDSILGDMDGIKFLECIKEIDSDIPVILTTYASSVNIFLKAIDIGVEGYIFKPLNPSKLLDTLNKFTKQILIQKDREKKNKLLEEYKRAIDAGSSVTKTNPAGIITYVNDSFCRLLGYTKKELIGKQHNIVRHPDTSKLVYKNMWKTIKNKEIWRGRIKNRKKNGETSYEYSTIVPILDENEDIIEYISLRQDLTELYTHKEYLKNRIKREIEKNTRLHEEQEKKNLLQEKFSTIGKMAAGITHEINTPLTYIKGNLELMIKDIEALDKNIKQKSYLQEDSKTILDGINRISTIIESMREMSSQTKELPKVENLYNCLTTALTLAYNKSKQISNVYIQNQLFIVGISKEHVKFNAFVQKQRIEQVFIIIINNAMDQLKLIGEFDSRYLKITLEEQETCIVVKFQDNGGGVDPNMLPKIFDPFQSSKEEGGMGIGLNVAKRIIDDHRGKIVPLNTQEGALFEVFIPKTSQYGCN